VGLAACGNSAPSVDVAQQALRRQIDKGQESRLRLASFRKTDGRAAEVMGVKAYDLMFASRFEFTSDAMFSVGAPFVAEGSEITTAELRKPSSGFSWNDFMAGSQGFHPARKGDALEVAGTISFEKRESGWVPTGIRFSFAQDSSRRPVASTNGGVETEVVRGSLIQFGDTWYAGILPAGAPDTISIRVQVTAAHPTFWISAGSVPNAGVSVAAFRAELFKNTVAGAASVDEALVSLTLRNPSGVSVAESVEYDTRTYNLPGKESTLKASNLAPGEYSLLVKKVRGAGRFSVRYFGGFGGD
jgi:hypothetical protein